MSLLTEEPMAAPGAWELRHAYATYKGLALSVGATLAMGRSPAGAEADARLLADRCREMAELDGPLRAQFDACCEAAERLAELAGSSGRAEDGRAGQRLSAARASHSRLRKLVWGVLPCEYIPCSGQGSKRDETRFATHATDGSEK